MSNDDKFSIHSFQNALTREWEAATGIKPLNTGIPHPLIGPDVPQHLAPKLEHHSRESGIPYIMAANLLGSESGFNADAVSPTKALGLAQMTSGARYERLYLDREALPPKAQNLITEGIERYDRANNPHAPYWAYRARNFEITDSENGETYNLSLQLDALAMDEDIALTIGFKHMAFSIKEGTRIYTNNLEGHIDWMETLQAKEIDKLREKLDKNSPIKPREDIDASNAAIMRRLQNLNTPITNVEQAEAHNAKIDKISASLRNYDVTLEEATAQNALIDKTAKIIDGYQTRINALKPEITRTFTAADLKTFYVCGATGGAELLEAAADPTKSSHRAADYAPASVVRSNPHLFYKNAINNQVPDNPQYIDVKDFYDHMKDLVGVVPIPDELTSKPQAPEPEPWLSPLDPMKP